MVQVCEAEIVLEICPTSNLLTKALPDEDAVRTTFRAFSDSSANNPKEVKWEWLVTP